MSRGTRGLSLFDVERTRRGIAAVLVVLLAALVLAILDGPESQALPSARGGGATWGTHRNE